MKLRFWFYILVGCSIIFIPYIPHFYWWLKTPPGDIYPFLHQYPLDYYLYLSSINQGKNGEWLLYPAFTTETNLSSGLFYFYFILVGKIAALFNLWVPVAYHAVKIACEFLYLVLLYKLAAKILGEKYGFWAALLSLVWTVPPQWYMGTQVWFPFPPWWYSYHPIERLDNLPHHFFGTTLLVGSLVSLLTYFESHRYRHLVITAFLVAAQSILFPPTTVFFLAAVPGAFAAHVFSHWLQTKRLLFPKKHLLAVAICFVIAGLGIGFIKWQETLGFPWNQWTPWELGRWNRGEPEFNMTLLKLFSVLPAALFLLVPIAWHKRNFSYFTLITWGLLPYVLLPFADLLSVPKIRLVQLIPTVPMAFAFVAVAAVLFGSLSRGKVFQVFMLAVLAIHISLAVTQYSMKWQYLYSEGRYLPLPVLEALDYLNSHAPRKTHVLSYEYDGILIPVFTQAIPYWAQLNQTYDFFKKKDEVLAFLTHQWPENESYDFLKRNNIEFVYYGPHEKSVSGGSMPYPFLEPVFRNTDVTIFKIK